MAGSVNKVILVGNVGRDPEIRRMGDGKPVVNLSIATSETWKDRNTGERKEKTEWHRVVIFNENIARVVEQYVKKGSKLYIEGALQTRKWTDQSGVEKYTTEIVIQAFNGQLTLLDSAGGNRGGGDDYGNSGGGFGDEPLNPYLDAPNASSSGQGGGFDRKPSGGGQKMADVLDDEIPF